jgi:hypothetical protein
MIHIRLAPEVKDFLFACAKKQERTMGAHITFLLRQEMEKEKAPEHGLENRSDASQK